jgi:hypothetical protein
MRARTGRPIHIGVSGAARTPSLRRPVGPIGGPTVAGLLALQTLAGNRAVARAVTQPALQRRGAQGLIDKRLAFKGTVPQVADDELVPVGEAPGRFDGFASLDQARALARRSPEVAVVVRDLDGRYHVLRTTAATLGSRATAPEDPHDWRVVEVVEPTKPAANRFQLDYQAAEAASGDEQIAAYRQLLVSGTHLELNETGWSSAENRHAPRKVNVALWLPSRGRHVPAKVTPTGTAQLPDPAILIGKSPFTQGPVSLRSTLQHEARHAYHMAQTLDLVDRWRQKRKQDTLGAWQMWLKSQKKTLPAEVYQTVWANTDPIYGTATTETYAHLHGFMYRFRRDDDARRDPASLDASATTALHVRMASLGDFGTFWEAAGQDAREQSLDVLVAFAAELTAHHRQHMRNFMARGMKGADSPNVFYRELAKRL